MKRKHLQKILTVIAITVSLTICGCGKAKEGNAVGVWEESDTAAVDRQIDETESSFVEDEEPEAEKTVDEDNEIKEKEENTVAKGEWQTIEGSVETIGEGNFMINQIFTEEKEDGAQIAVESMEDKTLVAVYYTDETEFIVRTTKDGLTSTDRPGTADELLSASSVILSGSWNGEGFQAGQIVIFVVDM